MKVIVAILLGVVLYVNGQAQPQVQPQPTAPQAPQQPPVQQPAPAQSAPLLSQHRPQPPPSGGDGSNAVDTLPAGADSIIGQLKPGFSCDGKVYGYYADIINDCRVFHVCWPITDERGATLNKQWTFICGNQTLFNQERLVCDRPENVDCANSENFFSVNNDFGKIPGAQ
ncbi:hypothetical protein CHUAL_013687 [Chamberlinius hualienensis]